MSKVKKTVKISENELVDLIDNIVNEAITVKKKEWIADYFIQGAAYAIAAYECGVAPTLPHEIQIYIFGPKRTQLFIEPFNADLASQWLKRLKAYQANQPVVV